MDNFFQTDHIDYTYLGKKCITKCQWRNDSDSSPYERKCENEEGLLHACTPFKCITL